MSLLFCASISPVAVAEKIEGSTDPADTRIEKYEDLTQVEATGANYDVRRTEAFNLVSSAYRGQFEQQGVNSYAVMISDYETGELTAETLINAAIEAGELSPNAMQDESYIRAVDSQLEALSNS